MLHMVNNDRNYYSSQTRGARLDKKDKTPPAGRQPATKPLGTSRPLDKIAAFRTGQREDAPAATHVLRRKVERERRTHGTTRWSSRENGRQPSREVSTAAWTDPHRKAGTTCFAGEPPLPARKNQLLKTTDLKYTVVEAHRLTAADYVFPFSLLFRVSTAYDGGRDTRRVGMGGVKISSKRQFSTTGTMDGRSRSARHPSKETFFDTRKLEAWRTPDGFKSNKSLRRPRF